MAHPESQSDQSVPTTEQPGIEPVSSHPPSFGSRLVPFLFCVGLLGLLAYFTPSFVSSLSSEFHEAWRSRSWPTVTATVLSPEVKTTGLGNRTRHEALVTYRYSVNGTDDTGHRICVDGFAKKISEGARDVSERYVVSREVQVHYDLHNPANSLLVTGPTSGMLMASILFPVLLGCFLLGTYQSFRALRPNVRERMRAR